MSLLLGLERHHRARHQRDAGPHLVCATVGYAAGTGIAWGIGQVPRVMAGA